MAKPVTHSVNFLSAAEDDLHRYIFNFTYFNLTQRALIHLWLIMFLSEVRQKKKCFWWLISQTFIIIWWFYFLSAWLLISIDSDFVLFFIISFIPMWFFTLQNRNSSALYSAHCWICSWPCFLVWCVVSREQVSGKKSYSFSFMFTSIFLYGNKETRLTCR